MNGIERRNRLVPRQRSTQSFWRRGRLAGMLAMSLGFGQAAQAGEPGPPPGRMLDVGGHRMHIQCEGSGAPTVVLDAGLGGSSLDWDGVRQELAHTGRVCGYDRAGMGWSESGPAPRTASRIADELFLLLLEAREQPPYVLVGHSFGGYVVQLFAHRYPYLVAGAVLVDASHGEQVERYAAPPLRLNIAPRRVPGAVQRVSYSTPKVPSGMPESKRTLAMSLLTQPKARRAMTDEYLYFRESAEQVRRAESFPPVPLVVISHGQRIWPEGRVGLLAENLWLQLQSELARLSPLSAHVIAERSGHHVPLDQPRLVADATAMVLDFAVNGEVLSARPRMMPATDRGERAARWLAFDHGIWISDHLRPGLGLHRAPPSGEWLQARSDTGRHMRIGHFSGTGQPASQQVVHFDK